MKINFWQWFLLCFNLLITLNVYADDAGYFNEHKRGWQWYEVKPKEEELVKEEDKTPAITEMSVVRKALQNALDKAILYPTHSNVKDYIQKQQETVNRAAKFQSVWQKVLLEEPSLDYNLKHPINNIAVKVENENKETITKETLSLIGKQSGLFFFYRSTCPYCRAFAPILKRFAAHYEVPIIAITTDGISLPEFPDSLIDRGQAKTFGVKVEPSLFIVNPYSKKAVPVSYGIISESELIDRLIKILNEQANDLE